MTTAPPLQTPGLSKGQEWPKDGAGESSLSRGPAPPPAGLSPPSLHTRLDSQPGPTTGTLTPIKEPFGVVDRPWEAGWRPPWEV